MIFMVNSLCLVLRRMLPKKAPIWNGDGDGGFGAGRILRRILTPPPLRFRRGNLESRRWRRPFVRCFRSFQSVYHQNFRHVRSVG